MNSKKYEKDILHDENTNKQANMGPGPNYLSNNVYYNLYEVIEVTIDDKPEGNTIPNHKNKMKQNKRLIVFGILVIIFCLITLSISIAALSIALSN